MIEKNNLKAMSNKQSVSEGCPNDSLKNARKYVLSNFENTYYLGYRDIPQFIEKYGIRGRAIDYGCGTGRSTRFLKSMQLEAIGVDISLNMLEQALEIDNATHYLHIKDAKIPILNNSYDLAFSCFVLFTVPTKEKLLAILKEIYRCLKNKGIFIIVTGSEKLYSQNWLSYNINYSENQSLESGSIKKIQLKDLGLDFVNYFWKDSDYCELFHVAGFDLIEKHYPLGKTDDGKEWISETEFSPYVIYVLQKNEAQES